MYNWTGQTNDKHRDMSLLININQSYHPYEPGRYTPAVTSKRSLHHCLQRRPLSNAS